MIAFGMIEYALSNIQRHFQGFRSTWDDTNRDTSLQCKRTPGRAATWVWKNMEIEHKRRDVNRHSRPDGSVSGIASCAKFGLAWARSGCCRRRLCATQAPESSLLLLCLLLFLPDRVGYIRKAACKSRRKNRDTRIAKL